MHRTPTGEIVLNAGSRSSTLLVFYVQTHGDTVALIKIKQKMFFNRLRGKKYIFKNGAYNWNRLY